MFQSTTSYLRLQNLREGKRQSRHHDRAPGCQRGQAALRARSAGPPCEDFGDSHNRTKLRMSHQHLMHKHQRPDWSCAAGNQDHGSASLLSPSMVLLLFSGHAELRCFCYKLQAGKKVTKVTFQRTFSMANCFLMSWPDPSIHPFF